jgi:hypothetical protein
MVHVTIRKDDAGRYFGFEMKGHAEYSEEGSDIVCAAVSMLSINTANAIETLTDTPFKVTADEKNKGSLQLELPEGSDDKSGLLMESYELGIRGVMDAYNGKKTYVSMKIAKV